jgi:hypothetical protein
MLYRHLDDCAAAWKMSVVCVSCTTASPKCSCDFFSFVAGSTGRYFSLVLTFVLISSGHHHDDTCGSGTRNGAVEGRRLFSTQTQIGHGSFGRALVVLTNHPVDSSNNISIRTVAIRVQDFDWNYI